VAARRPHGLVAIAAFQGVADLYRGVGRPGGIFNRGFASFWADVVQPSASRTAASEGGATGEARCADAVQRLTNDTGESVETLGEAHPFDDATVQDRVLGRGQWRRIDVPVLACFTWQDDELSSLWSDTLTDLEPARLGVHAANGFHGQCEQQTRLATEFFDRYLRGRRNAFAAVPHVVIDHETRVAFPAGPSLEPPTRPDWTTTHKRRPVRTRTARLRLGRGGRLTTQRPSRVEKVDAYAYPRPAADQASPRQCRLSG
jgi:predicted acyl esterase